MTVLDLKKGEQAKITSVKITGSARMRLEALGIRTGGYVRVLGFSLFKSSVLISCEAVRVGIRRAMAEKIEVSL